MSMPKPVRGRAARLSARRRAFAEAFESRRLLAATPELVNDINRTTDHLSPGPAVEFGYDAIFAGRATAGGGSELFKTDGTKVGTVLLKDINPGGGSYPDLITRSGNKVLFVADDGSAGRELWLTDGTDAGTVRVVDLRPGAASSLPTLLTAAGFDGRAFFVADDGGGATLWYTDGTAAGTARVTVDGAGGRLAKVTRVAYANGRAAFVAGGLLYYVSMAAPTAASLIAAAPAGVQNVVAFGGPSASYSFAFTIGGTGTGTSPGDLWRTDGTDAGTVRVKAIDFTGGFYGDRAGVDLLVATPLHLYFVAGDITGGKYDLWTSNGSAAGTFALTTTGTLSRTVSPAAYGEALMFQNTTAAAGTEPWITDGSVEGTRLLVDSVPGPGSPTAIGATPLTGTGRFLFTTVPGDGTATKLWTLARPDSSPALIGTVNGAATGTVPIGSLNGVALFDGISTYPGGDLYRSDGTAAGSFRLGATVAGNGSSLSDVGGYAPSQFFPAAGGVYYTATDGYGGFELYYSATGVPARRLSDFVDPGVGAPPSDFVAAADDSIYFTAGGSGARSIYRVADNNASPKVVLSAAAVGGASLSGLTTLGNTLYFRVAGGSVPGTRLYRFDPSIGQAAAVTVGGSYLSSYGILRAGNYGYFGAAPTTSTGSYTPGQRLYRVGVGASAVPELVADIPSGGADGAFGCSPLVAAGSTLYFEAWTAAAGSELWRTDGTAAGTAIVADLTPGAGSTQFDDAAGDTLGLADGTAYFTAYANGSNVRRAYRTDGTAAGTVAVDGSGVSTFAQAAGKVLCLVADGVGTAIARVDGTATSLVYTSVAGDGAFRPYTLTVAGGRTFAVGLGGLAGAQRWELWQSSASGVAWDRVTVLGPRVSIDVGGPLLSYWSYGRFALGATANDLYFPMYADATGVEPYRLPLNAPATAGSIAGAVYQDVNGNGVRDGYDAAASAVDVWIDRDGDGAFDASSEPRTTSAADGTYRFDGLTPGTYAVHILSAGYRRVQVGTASEIVVVAGGVTAAADLSVTTYIGVTPTTVDEGGKVALTGRLAGEIPPDLVYTWDFNAVMPGAYTIDATGQTVTYDAAMLDGTNDDSSYRLTILFVRDAAGTLVSSLTFPLLIKNVAPTATLYTQSSVAAGNASTVRFVLATDPGAADVAAGFRYSVDFNNDGDFADAGDVLNSSSPTASFAFAKAGTYAIRGRVMDKDGGFTDYTTAAVVTAAATPPAPTRVGFTQTDVAVEGGKGGTLEGHADVVPGQSIVKWEYDYSYDGVTFAADSAGVSPTGFLSVDDGPVTVTVAIRATDNYGQSVIAAQPVRVYNTGPHATFGATASNNVATATFTNVSDASAADRAAGFTYSFDFNNNGVYTDAGDVRLTFSPTASFAYAAAGTYTIRGIVADKDGAYVEFTTRATVTAPPAVKPPPPANVGWDVLAIPTEGATIGLIGGASPLASGQSIVTWAWDYDYDGARFDVDATGKQPSITLPDGRSTRQVALRVTDNFGQVVTKTQTLTIANVAPTATFNATGGAGKATATLANAADPSAVDRAAGFRYSFDFNNDGDFTDPGEVDRGTSPAATGTYSAAGTYTVLARVYDKDGDYNKYVATVTVAAPPAPAQQPPVPGVANGLIYEGQKTLFYGDATLAAGRTAAKWEWDFDYVGTTFTVDASTQQALFDATNVDGPSTRRVALRVTDSAGQVGLAVKTVSVLNVIPSAGYTLVVNADGSVTATFVNPTDVGAADRAAGFTYSFDFSGGYDDYLDPGDIVRSTSPTATHKYAASGTYLIGARLYDKDGDYGSYGGQRVTVTVPATPPPTTTPVLLTGTPIGTAGGIGGNTIAKAFDGGLATYVDLPGGGPYAIGLDLGVAKRIASVRFAPRAGLARRMTGGIFQASNSATFAAGGVVTLGTIAAQPAEGVLTTLAFAASTTAYRYVRYVPPANSFGNVAELQFFGGGTTTTTPPVVTPPPPSTGTLTKLTGTAIGTAGAINGNGFAKALDGDLGTYVDSSTASGAYVGLDLGTAKVIRQLKFAPRATLGRRMVGGYFQASDSADFGVATTLYTIAIAPPDGVLSVVDLTGTTAYRYVRYVAPANGFGNVAEVQFYG